MAPVTPITGGRASGSHTRSTRTNAQGGAMSAPRPAAVATTFVAGPYVTTIAGAMDAMGTNSGCQSPSASVHPQIRVLNTRLVTAATATAGQSPVPQACVNPCILQCRVCAMWPNQPPTIRPTPA